MHSSCVFLSRKEKSKYFFLFRFQPIRKKKVVLKTNLDRSWKDFKTHFFKPTSKDQFLLKKLKKMEERSEAFSFPETVLVSSGEGESLVQHCGTWKARFGAL